MNDSLSLWTPPALVDLPRDLQRWPTLLTSKSRPGVVEGINLKRLYEFPFWLTTDQPNNSVTVPANGTATLLAMRASNIGPCIVSALGVRATGAALVALQIMDGQTPQTLMNQPIHSGAILGSGTLPYILREPIYIDETRNMMTTFTDISGSSNTIRLVAASARHTSSRYDPGLKLIRKRMAERQFLTCPFWYTTDQGAVALTALGTANVGISIAPDHHFLLHQMSLVATSRALNIELIDTTKGKSLIDGVGQRGYEISANLLFGDNNYPYIFPEPILFEGGTKIQVNMTDRSNATNTVYLALHGQIIRKYAWTGR